MLPLLGVLRLSFLMGRLSVHTLPIARLGDTGKAAIRRVSGTVMNGGSRMGEGLSLWFHPLM
jgi:hypothetical protein